MGFKGCKHTKEAIEKMRAAATGRKHTEESCKKMSAAHSGVKLSTEHRARMSAAAKRVMANPEARAKISAAVKGYKHTPEACAKMTAALLRNYRDPVHCAKMRAAWNRKPNKPEISLLALLEELYPGEWKYTGDFSMTINGKCPDFVNSNGQKKVIELFGDYWHQGDDPKERAKMFAPLGYTTLVIWQSELKNKKKVVGRIRRFAAQ
jgi:G:T-mismatch repair DNA endonuclease (very short patch repair protein)